MSNPTRAEVEGHLRAHSEDANKHHNLNGQFVCHCSACHFGRGCLRGLGMRDALSAAIKTDGRDEGVTEDGYPYWISGRIADEIKKFDEGDDGSARVTVAGGLDRPLADFVRSCEVLLEEEWAKANPNSALRGVLCDAIRLAREFDGGDNADTTE